MIPILDLQADLNPIRQEIDDAIKRVLDNGQFIMGDEVTLFEQEVAQYLGTKYAISVNSGTDALVIALRALNIGENDEVITSPFSFFATAESISSVGAKPIFVDIDPSSFNIDTAQIERAITRKTKAIIPVHLYGNAANMNEIQRIAKQYNLKVVEDCAQSFGNRFHSANFGIAPSQNESIDNKFTGTIGDLGAYSFFPSKNLGAFGDGGLITTDDENLANTSKMLRVHGAKKKYHNEVIGYNSRLDTIQAAILRVKLRHIDTWNRMRFEAAGRYNHLLNDVAEIVCPKLDLGHVFHQYTIIIKNHNRDDVQNTLLDSGIGTMVYYPIPQDKLPVYANDYDECPISSDLADKVLSLPIWPSITDDAQQKVVSALKHAVSK
jgi:dTDP-4-amino-4,6-dideoxygalactose transaminase